MVSTQESESPTLTSTEPRQEGRKRPREETPHWNIADENDEYWEHRNHSRLRPTVLKDSDLNYKPDHLIVYQVNCNHQSQNHQRHTGITQFRDEPRLYQGDNKASALRGLLPMGNVDAFLDENPGVSFVVYRQHDCVAYQESLKNDFKRLQLPLLDPQLAIQLRPYFFILDRDARPAPVDVEYIKLTSQVLLDAMRTLAQEKPLEFVGWDSESNLLAPYLNLYHLQRHINGLLTRPNLLDEISQHHIYELMGYFTEAFGGEYYEAEALFDTGYVSRKHFHKLFGPNEVLVSNEGSQPVAYVNEKTPASSTCTVQLRCRTWAFDGFFRREEKTISINWTTIMPEEVPINSLSAYPLKFDQTGLHERLQKRGETFWSCRKRRYVSYKAPKMTFEVQVANPRYMVDISMYHQLHATDEAHPMEQRDDLGPEKMDSDEPPNEDNGYFTLLLPPDILGFGFHDKKWRRLLVEHIGDVQWNKAAFERLVLDESKKELVKALIQVHIDNNTTTDVIEGKGNGLIILLHGGPGTGKTLTAESVAEEAEKPLYRVTCGDIGTEPEAVEKYLDSVLYIGSIWKAVVLLDESDVFLEERTQTDLQRNALVSVFLRVLEYYEGILILTSNRVGMFDEAFKSRIQLAMHYPPLDSDGRWRIWDNFIQALEQQPGEVKTEQIRSKINYLAKHELNGRQIRNALKTAKQLATFKKEPLGFAHLDRTIKVVMEFEDYVEKTHGHTDSEYAKHSGTRLE